MMFMLPILINAETIVETGFQDGMSTNIFLKALVQLPEIQDKYRCLHTFEFTQPTDHPDTIRGREQAMQQLRAQYRTTGSSFEASKAPVFWDYCPFDSVTGAKNFKITMDRGEHGPDVDFLYLDSDHKDTHVYNELVEWCKVLSDKAIIMIDDAFDYDKQVPTGPMIAANKWNEQHSEWQQLVFPEMHGPMVLYR